MSRLFEPSNRTDTRQFAIEIRRAAIKQIAECDKMLGWQTEVIRITEHEQKTIQTNKTGKTNS